MRAIALVLLLLAGCATAPRTAPDADAVTTLEQEQARQETRLAADARPDCPRARSLRDNICALAEKICVLVARDPTIPDGPRRCQTARARCEAARTRVRGACPS
jgi:hypothetical protein